MELRHLRYFVALAEAWNFTKAATRLHVAQPALNRQVSDLEDEQHVDLLTRTSHGVLSTVEGKLFLEDGCKVFSFKLINPSLAAVNSPQRIEVKLKTNHLSNRMIGLPSSHQRFRLSGWPAYERKFRARLLPSHRRAISAILSCRTPALGGQLFRCECGKEHYAYHSCNHRACPKCGHADATEWLDRQRRRLLPVPYYLVTFTLPAQLRRLIRSNQKSLYALLLRESPLVSHLRYNIADYTARLELQRGETRVGCEQLRRDPLKISEPSSTLLCQRSQNFRCG